MSLGRQGDCWLSLHLWRLCNLLGQLGMKTKNNDIVRQKADQVKEGTTQLSVYSLIGC